jgi:quercetin dioxygenase-like cupin family protein
LPDFQPEFVLTKAGASPAQGRAGMLYRDLIPGRLGGRYIASHITIPEGGPVSDWVHYHRVALQLIVVRAGWVRLVYQDQGEPFVMNAGDIVLQPPQIRHRVLESSGGLEVVEIGAPALHETLADHELGLPNRLRPGREFGGQRFLHHVAADAAWSPFNEAEVQETQMFEATGGLADVMTLRAAGAPSIAFKPHDGELVFGFVLDGKAQLDGQDIGPADAFAIPPDRAWAIDQMSDDFRLLHVTTARLDGAA